MTRESPRVRRLPAASLIEAAVGMLLAAQRGQSQDGSVPHYQADPSRAGRCCLIASQPRRRRRRSAGMRFAVSLRPARNSSRCCRERSSTWRSCIRWRVASRSSWARTVVGPGCITSGTQPVAGGLQSWCKLKRGVLVVVALGAIAYRSQWGSLTVPPCARAAATAAAMSSTRPLRAPWPAVGERWSCRCSGARRARQVAAVPWTNGNNELRDQKTIPLRDGRAPNDRDRTGQPGDCRSVRDREPANAGTSRGGCRTAVLRTAPNRLICARCSGGGRPQRNANIRRSEQTRGATTSKSYYCL